MSAFRGDRPFVKLFLVVCTEIKSPLAATLGPLALLHLRTSNLPTASCQSLPYKAEQACVVVLCTPTIPVTLSQLSS